MAGGLPSWTTVVEEAESVLEDASKENETDTMPGRVLIICARIHPRAPVTNSSLSSLYLVMIPPQARRPLKFPSALRMLPFFPLTLQLP